MQMQRRETELTPCEEIGADGRAPSLQLLGGFSVTDRHGPIDLPASVTRLVAFLAIQGRPSERVHTAICLWMDKPESRAQANLRSCLWRLRQARIQLVCCSATHLWLDTAVSVDLHQIRRAGDDLMAGHSIDPLTIDLTSLCAELLPAWYDDFVQIEREQLRQLRLHTLEQLADQYRRAGVWGRALRLALTAVACDPLRESAHRMVMAIHLDEGNVSEALRQYDTLAALLAEELGIAPSGAAREMIDGWLEPVRPARAEMSTALHSV